MFVRLVICKVVQGRAGQLAGGWGIACKRQKGLLPESKSRKGRKQGKWEQHKVHSVRAKHFSTRPVNMDAPKHCPVSIKISPKSSNQMASPGS